MTKAQDPLTLSRRGPRQTWTMLENHTKVIFDSFSNPFCRQSHLQFILSFIFQKWRTNIFHSEILELWGGWYYAEKSAFRQIDRVCELF